MRKVELRSEPNPYERKRNDETNNGWRRNDIGLRNAPPGNRWHHENQYMSPVKNIGYQPPPVQKSYSIPQHQQVQK